MVVFDCGEAIPSSIFSLSVQFKIVKAALAGCCA